MPAQRLQQAAEAMVDAARRRRSVAAALREHSPHIYEQIAQDAKHPGLLAAWGKSRNVDDNVGETIVPAAIVEAIGALAGVTMRGPNVHAGLLHTYGYLFSTLATPYGLKRERWISQNMERGFRLDTRLLSDQPSDGTLLGNVSWLFAQFAFRDVPDRLRPIEKGAAIVAEELERRDFTGCEVRRIVEQAEPSGSLKRAVTFVTDLVTYPHPPADEQAENTLLVYSVQLGRRAPRKLVTGFPMRAAAVKKLLDEVPSDGRAFVGPRYNAYVPGLASGETVPGRVSLASTDQESSRKTSPPKRRSRSRR